MALLQSIISDLNNAQVLCFRCAGALPYTQPDNDLLIHRCMLAYVLEMIAFWVVPSLSEGFYTHVISSITLIVAYQWSMLAIIVIFLPQCLAETVILDFQYMASTLQ